MSAPIPPLADEPLELVRTRRRDERFTRLWNSRGRLPDFDAPTSEVNWRHWWPDLYPGVSRRAR